MVLCLFSVGYANLCISLVACKFISFFCGIIVGVGTRIKRIFADVRRFRCRDTRYELRDTRAKRESHHRCDCESDGSGRAEADGSHHGATVSEGAGADSATARRSLGGSPKTRPLSCPKIAVIVFLAKKFKKNGRNKKKTLN